MNQSDASEPIVLLAETDNAFGLRLTLENQEVDCYAAFFPAHCKENLTPPTLRAILSQLSVNGAINNSDVADFCQAISSTKKAPRTLVAQGTSPQKGADECLDLVEKPKGHPLPTDGQGRVDLKTIQVFDNVEPGDIIGQIHPAQQGEDGVTARGVILPGLFGDPMTVKIGSGIQQDHDTGQLIAEISGRIVQARNQVSISPIYEVTRVDYHVGNIVFNGQVKVSEDVLDGFNVRATGPITVAGTIGHCTVEGGSDITLGTMAGHGKGVLRSQGTITADNLIDAIVEAEGNVIVRHEIRNCTVRTKGQVLVDGGMITGGRIIALQGIEVGQAGATSGLATHLTAGRDYEMEDQKERLQIRLNTAEEQLTQATRVIDTIKKRVPVGEAPPSKLEKMLERQQGLKKTWHELLEQMETLTRQTIEGANPKINIQQHLHDSVTLSLGEVSTEIKTERPGPMSIIENIDQQTLKSLPLTPLSLTAEELRDEFSE